LIFRYVKYLGRRWLLSVPVEVSRFFTMLDMADTGITMLMNLMQTVFKVLVFLPPRAK
jgi:hypothetical protein